MHAMRAAMDPTLGSSPGSLTFNRGKFLNIPFIADWHTINQRREHLINENLIREKSNIINTTMPLNKGCLRKNGNLAS
jgi:hypothetical protein